MPLPLARRLALARDVLEVHWFQPATALWRVYEVEVVRERLRAAGHCLDLGCGDGSLARVLLGGGPARWIGVDVESPEVVLARREGGYAAVAAASAEALPLAGGSFDLVFANSALEHMADLEAVLAEASRVLRPGGRLVFTVPSVDFHRALFWPQMLRAAGLQRRAGRYVEHLDRRLRHLRYPSEDEWREGLHRHGLELRVAERYLSRRVCGCWETLSNLTGGVAHRLRRDRPSPREVQLRAGLRPRRSRALGTFAFVVLAPVLLWTALDRRSRTTAGLYVEASRAAEPGEEARR